MPPNTSPPVWILAVPGAGASQHDALPAGGEDAHPANSNPTDSNKTNRIIVTIRPPTLRLTPDTASQSSSRDLARHPVSPPRHSLSPPVIPYPLPSSRIPSRHPVSPPVIPYPLPSSRIPSRHPVSPPVIPVLVTGINRGTVLTLIPVTSTGMTDNVHGTTDNVHWDDGQRPWDDGRRPLGRRTTAIGMTDNVHWDDGQRPLG